MSNIFNLSTGTIHSYTYARGKDESVNPRTVDCRGGPVSWLILIDRLQNVSDQSLIHVQACLLQRSYHRPNPIEATVPLGHDEKPKRTGQRNVQPLCAAAGRPVIDDHRPFRMAQAVG
jgi:hypothetical protein